MARTLIEANMIIAALEAKIRELEELTLDDLTGLPRRKVLQAAVEEEILRCARTNKTFSLLVIDLNFLRTVNNTHGHPAGDAMITSFASCLRASVRGCDIVARTGGDEFMVFLPDQNEQGCVSVMAHLQEQFKEAFMPYFRGAAIGAATSNRGLVDFKELYNTADKRMYAHKAEMKQGT